MKTILYIFVVIFMATIFLFCKNDITSKSDAALAKTYCSTCHLFPQPDILDQKTWEEYILPRMGAMMGHYSKGLERDSLLGEGATRQLLLEANIYPEHPTIRQKEWKRIQDFYLSQAPEKLIADSIQQIIKISSLFKVNYPDLFLSPPSSTFVALDSNKIIVADANKQVLLETDSVFSIKKQAKVGEALVHLFQTKESVLATVMGSFSPVEVPNGYILNLKKNANEPSHKIISGLQRPVHSVYQDFNQDGLSDVLVCEFGKWTGKLSLHVQNKQGGYKKINLLNRPGAIRTEITDFNQDGLMDILALFGQGDEGIILLTNQGNNEFEAKPLIRFHPSMGSSYFTLRDWNQDGLQDIIYTAGDNADYPSLLKPYHGIYIFIQQENFQFVQKEFFPLHGAYKAIPADFDLDGDIDLAAISFFPDYSNSMDQSFVFFENQEETFSPMILTLKNKGRWIAIDAGDLDQDGDQDLILGALTFEVPKKPELVQSWINDGLPFVILENLSKN